MCDVMVFLRRGPSQTGPSQAGTVADFRLGQTLARAGKGWCFSVHALLYTKSLPKTGFTLCITNFFCEKEKLHVSSATKGQGSHSFGRKKFQEFSRNFPGLQNSRSFPGEWEP